MTMEDTPADHRSAYWRRRGMDLEAILDDWEATIEVADNVNDEDLRSWLVAARERLIVARESLSWKVRRDG